MLFEKVGPHFYRRIDTALPAAERSAREERLRQASPARIGGLKVTGINTSDGYKFVLEDGGWLLIRFSGTEPIVRVYCETTESGRVDPILQDGLRLAGLG
jgi:phosphomannomutase